jgi:hypothetical protein
MKVAVERRGDQWLAQIVHIGENLHWMQHQRIQHAVRTWVEQNTTNYAINGWQFYFKHEQDLVLFLLRWQ